MKRLLIAGALVVLLAGCKVDATLSIDVREDGSGVVEVRVDLDADAVSEAEVGGAALEDRVRLGDLQDAGWQVTPWQRHEDGGATLRIAKDFAKPEDLTGVIAELNGPDGPVRDVELSREEGLLRTSYALDGIADLSALRTGVTTDAELVASLTAQQVDLAAIDQRLLGQIDESFRLEIEVSLPGEHATFEAEPGESVALDASSTRFEPPRTLLIAGAALLALTALLILVTGERRAARRRRRRRRRGSA